MRCTPMSRSSAMRDTADSGLKATLERSYMLEAFAAASIAVAKTSTTMFGAFTIGT